MSLDEARRVIWQTQPKAPMGQLLDDGIITRTDLEWAARKAFRHEVKRAAQRLLQELDHPTALSPSAPVAPAEPPRYGARVVIAGHYLENQQEDSFGNWVFGLAASMMLLVYAITDSVRSLMEGEPIYLVVIVIYILALAYGIWYTNKHLQRWRSYHLGRKGEEQALEHLRQALDSRWTIYRNLQPPDRRDDLDLVLVGPGGVWAVQVKATKAQLRFQGGCWEVYRRRRWVAAQPDPAKQVTHQATALNEFLARNGITRYIERSIVLHEGLPEKNFADSPIPVWLPFNIEHRAASLTTRYLPSAEELARINDVLGRRVIEQQAETKVSKGKKR